MKQELTTLCAGHVTHDRVGVDIVPGGCAFYAARTFQCLGARSLLVSTVGEDFACDAAIAQIECRLERQGRTTVFENSYPGGSMRLQTVTALAPDVVVAQMPTDWTRPDVFFVGPVMGEVDLGAWKNAVQAGVVAIGVQGFIRKRSATRVVPSRWSPGPEELAGVDVACLSEEDLTGQGDLLEHLCASIPIVALTRERKGCDIITAKGSCWVGIHPASVVDPTGAGDTFAAGFLYALATGQPPEAAARLGAAAASIIIESRAGEGFARMGEAFARASSLG
ncbi:MAG TPA: PfkB family carbohydrate kinase [Myxococcota bacterium]|nr:PfkB family carbohydrate kinase [Myxococcota bacterium]